MRRSSTRGNYRRSSFSTSYGDISSFIEKNPHLRKNKVKSNPTITQNLTQKVTISSLLKTKNGGTVPQKENRIRKAEISPKNKKTDDAKRMFHDRTLLPERDTEKSSNIKEMSVSQLNGEMLMNENVNIIRRDIQGKHGKYNTFYSRLPIPSNMGTGFRDLFHGRRCLVL